MVKFLKLLDQQVDLLKVKWVSTLFDSRSFLWQKTITFKQIYSNAINQ